MENSFFARYAVACGLKQIVNRKMIAENLNSWQLMNGECREIEFVSDKKSAIEIALISAKNWDSSFEENEYTKLIESGKFYSDPLRGIFQKSIAKNFLSESEWAISNWNLINRSKLCASAFALGKNKIAKKWLPIFEAFENGAICLWIFQNKIYVGDLSII